MCTRSLDQRYIDEAGKKDIEIFAQNFLDMRICDPTVFQTTIFENTAPFLFTSVYAVKALQELEERTTQRIASRIAYCIQGNTSKTAMENGFEIKGTGENSVALAEEIIKNREHSVLHCTAKLRLADLESKLTQANIQYRWCEVYEKALSPVVVNQYDGVVFYSPSQVQAFLQANTLDRDVPAFCLGFTTAHYLSRNKHTNIQIANHPTTRDILQSIYRYFNKLNG